MDLNYWSFVLSVIGLAFGILSASSQLKAIFSSFSSSMGAYFRRLQEKKEKQIVIMLEKPSVFLACLAEHAVQAVMIIIVTAALILIITKIQDPVLLGINRHISFFSGLAFGYKLTSIFSLTKSIKTVGFKRNG